MDLVAAMNRVVDYIENNLCGEIDYEEISRICACPIGVFQRVFVMAADVPLSEYIRRRRLTQAAYDIQSRDIKVIDAAMKYGYDSPDSFCVAFKRLHGVAPTMARQSGVILKAYPRLSFHLVIKGAAEMNYRVVERDAFRVIGVSAHSSVEKDIWGRCKRDGTLEKLLEIGGGKPSLGLCFGYDAEGNNTYMVAVESDAQTGGFEAYDFPKSTWLVFGVAGSIAGKALGEAWQRIYGEFMPQSSYRQAQLPTIEVYQKWDLERDACQCEIWIPVE